ncbi:MAG: hypothetical protein KF854_12005 [Nitrospira sp.]|nr:hypothetical protein [Nitrospira sp.]HMZ55529.1 hypothetical protein [Nitrospira sp.]HNA27225.1 hypothetical protein [Nitrospira sp.]HNI68386.1 hypothetical protein [Nitrospira sp.]HNK15240.1 hypothetical protein [Nitrospira sp.]
MNRLSIRTSAAVVTLGVALLYLALALVAPGCSFAHAAPSGDHHQHSGTDSHSTLCSWACQATSDVGPVAHAAGGMVLAVQLHQLPSAPLLIDVQRHASLHTRAPPVSARG